MESEKTEKSFMGEVPPLADVDVELWTEYLEDYIESWMLNTPQFILEQKQKMLRMALCPFLFGITHSVPLAWQEILHMYGVIEKDRLNQTTTLSETEMEMLEMAETIFSRCSQLVENKHDLKTMLNFIFDVEERASMLNQRIDMNYALRAVVHLEVFASMWAPVKRIYENRKRQAHVCIIYYFKIISQHVIFYGRDGGDKDDYLKKVLSKLNEAEKVTSVSLLEGIEVLDDNNFTLAVDQDSPIIKNEPLSNLVYSNRAQAFLSVCDYRSALCDSKRAILLDPNNYKHYMWAAKCYLELGNLDRAEETNNQSLELCKDPELREEILQQSQEIGAKSSMTKVRENEVSSGSEERETDNVQVQYRRLVYEGSDCYLSNMFSRAMEQFKSALNILARSENEGLTVPDDDLMVLWFVYGMACVKTAKVRNIQAAIEKFSAIISRSERFPAAYYGLGLAHMVLTRYKEAEEELRTGLEQISKCRDARVCLWPQTIKEIEETDIPTLKKLMEESLQECLHPPKPDAVCILHADSSKREIYIADPDYKGHICIKCRAGCFIEFHAQCWKMTDNFRRHNWKEMLDTPCSTPGCWGLISDVFICRPDQEKSLKLSSQADNKPKDQPPRPKLKMKSESTSKLEKKLERKRLRKERRQEDRGLNQEDSEEQLQNIADTRYQLQLDEEEAARNLDRSGTVLLKAEPEVMIEHKKHKASKIKKKEKKHKLFLTVNVQFKGDEDKERYGLHSLDDDGDFVDRPKLIGNHKLLPAAASGLPSLMERPTNIVNAGLFPTPGSGPTTSTDMPKGIVNPKLAPAPGSGLTTSTEMPKVIVNAGLLPAPGSGFTPSTDMPKVIVIPKLLPAPGSGLSTPLDKPKLIVNAGLFPVPGSGPTTPTDKPQSSNKDIFDVTLYDLFYRILCEKGPLDLFGKEFEGQIKFLSDAAQTRIHQCGGLVNFLSFDSRFNISQNNIISTTSGGKPAVPHQAAQRNPWERHQLEEESNNSSNLHSLNPGAKEFVPHEATSASDSHSSGGHAELTDPRPTFAESAANKLPAPIQDSDDGFTTVVNKKRISVRSIPSDGQPDTYRYLGARPASSYSSLDEFKLVLKHAPIENVDNLDKDESKQFKTLLARGRVDTTDASWNDHPEVHPARRSSGVPLSVPIGLTTNITSHSSDASDVSGEDILRVSSPALSTNSGSSSSRADSSQNSSQVSGQPPSLRPLKAPAITLPSRGKKKKPLGHISSKLYSHPRPPLGDGSLVYDGYEEESVSSTTSDRDSSCGDPRPLLTEKSLPAASDARTSSSAANKDNNSVTNSSLSDTLSRQGQGSFIYAHHQNRTFEPESSHTEFETSFPGRKVFPNEYIPSNQGLGNNFQVLKDELGSKGFSDENRQTDLRFQKTNQSYHVSNGAQENTLRNKSIPSSFKSLQQPIQQPQSKPQDLGQADARSEKKVTFETNTFPDASWSSYNYFSTPKTYTADHEIRNQSSEVSIGDPWLKRDSDFFSLSSDEAVYRKGLIEQEENPLTYADTNSQNSVHIQSKHCDSEVFPSVLLPKDFVGSEKLIQTDPWSKSADRQRSHLSMSSDIKYSNESSLFSSFETWKQSSSMDNLYTSSTYTPQSTAGIRSTTQANTGINNRSITPVKTNSGTSLHSSISRHPESSTSLPWALSDAGSNALHFKGTQYKTAEVQTALTGAEIDEMRFKLKLLKESHAAKEAALLEKLQIQETLKNCEKQLSREKVVTEKLKQDIKKLVTRIQTAETTTEKWKDDSDQLLIDNHRLQVQNQAHSDDILEVNKQLDTERLKFFNAQMEILELKSVLAKDRLDVKRQEAVQHLQRLANVISKGDTAARSLPDSVYKKHKELSSYITSCDVLKQKTEVNAQRLKQDLIQGITVDLSQIDVTPPAFPQPPSELTDKPQATSNSEAQARVRTKELAPPSYSTESLNKAPKPAYQLEKAEDEDSNAYLSMFYSGSRDSAGVQRSQRDAPTAAVGRGTTYHWDEHDVDPGKKGSFNSSAQLSAPWASSKQANPQARPLSPAVPSWVVLPGNSTLPGKKPPMTQLEAIGAALTSNVGLQAQHPRAHAAQKLPENVQQPTKQTSYFERIVATVEDNLPGYSRIKIQQTVDKLRRNNGGSLSGWTFEELANRVLDTILDSEQDESQADVSAPDEHLSNHWPKLSKTDLQCSICQSEIEAMDSLNLSCGHKFHESCLQKWFQSDRTCPNCRSHALLLQDFPTLK